MIEKFYMLLSFLTKSIQIIFEINLIKQHLQVDKIQYT